MFLIEKAKPEEILEIKQLLKDTWVSTFGTYYSAEMIEEITSSWHDPKRLSEQIQNPDCYFAVARDNAGRIMGIVTARRIENNQTLQLDRLYVLPAFQGKGIGKELLHRASHAFEGVATIFLDVEAKNTKAIEFYKKQGFEEYDESEETIGDKSFKVIEMKKNLR